MGINRNIVECKYENKNKGTGTFRVLIETLWNVNKSHEADRQGQLAGINRNIVECKFFSPCCYVLWRF